MSLVHFFFYFTPIRKSIWKYFPLQILLFRNTQTTGTTTCTLTTATPNIVKTASAGNQIAVLSNKDDEKTETKPKTKSISSNVPLGAGK